MGQRGPGGARAMAMDAFCARTVARLPGAVAERLEVLAGNEVAAGAAGPGLLADIRSGTAQLGLDTFLVEVDKLERVRALQVPVDLFEGASETPSCCNGPLPTTTGPKSWARPTGAASRRCSGPTATPTGASTWT
jgi:hypothetical protein